MVRFLINADGTAHTATSAGGDVATQLRDPSHSPEGTRGTEPLTEATAQRNAELVETWADQLYNASAAEIMTWAQQYAPGKLVVTLSMENTVLAELAHQYLPEADFLFLDTGYHFPETLQTARAVEERYSNRLVWKEPILSRSQQDEVYGPQLYRRNPTACCRMRKVEPMAAALSPYVGWITGLRRVDSPTRAQAPALSVDSTGRLKISPIITWTLADTERFIEQRHLIENPLTHQGYPSIGCATCTLPVEAGADPRSGRWAGQNKTECGLHTT